MALCYHILLIEDITFYKLAMTLDGTKVITFFVKTKLFIIIYISGILLSLNLYASQSSDLDPQSLYFSENHADTAFKPYQSIGLSFGTVGGLGVNYVNNYAENRAYWINIEYNDSRRVFTEPLVPTALTAYAEIHEKNSALIMAGLSRTFKLFNSVHWGFVVGGGVSLNYKTWEAKYYRQACNFLFCGFDSSNPYETQQKELYTALNAKLGVVLNHVRMSNVRGDIFIGVLPEVFRTPQAVQFTGPDGTTVKPLEYARLVFEGSIAF